MTLTIGLVAASILIVATEPPTAPSAAKAPEFSAAGSDGKTHTLKSLTAGGKTLVLHFIQSTCPINADAMKFYKQVASAYKDNKKVAYVGVIDENAAGYKAWQKEFDAKFLVLYDQDKEIIRSYRAMASPWIIVVDTKGEMSTIHRGYSAGRVNELNTLMAKAGGVAAAKIDVSAAPESERFG